MAARAQPNQAQAGDILLVVHDFKARSADELSLTRGDKIELIERDDDFGDGWFLGRHLQSEETGLFPEVYTTPAPKPTSAANAARRLAAAQSGHAVEISETNLSGSQKDDSLKAPSVQPPAINQDTLEADNLQPSRPSSYGAAERSFSAPLQYSATPNTPPSASTVRRTPPTSSAQRSISLSNGTHQNSPVMNETLSVIEEHITDMSTPRQSLLMSEGQDLREEDELDSSLIRRLSYINGHETDDEESGLLSEKEVRGWSPNRVAEYLDDVGVEHQQCQVFKEQEITGDVLLGMDQGSLMLKEFELGSIGRRLALWQKIKALQEEVRISNAVPRTGSSKSTIEGSIQDPSRNRSTSVGTVLPRIPSLMENASSRGPSRQSLQRSPSHQQSTRSDSLSSLPTITDTSKHEHSPRPSAASVRSLNQNRRHSSIDYAATSLGQNSNNQAQSSPTGQISHSKQGSLDRSWTMGSNQSPTDTGIPITEPTLSPSTGSTQTTSMPYEVGMTVVSSLDLDRGYFSGNEVDNRKARNVLRKRTGESPGHSRAPSDGYNPRRLSGVFRQKRNGSTDSLHETANSSTPFATQKYYSTGFRSNPRATSGPPIGKSWKRASPAVTRLDYSNSPSIDAVAASPNIPSSETSSIERPTQSPAPHTKSVFTKSRATGLRAISDAITGDERALVFSPASEKSATPIKESPLQSPSSQNGSSTPSINSKSIDLDDSSLLKSGTGSSGRHTPTTVPRRKGKKSTSAYTRGLEKKSPKEQIIGCDYSGWMKKKSSNLMATWKTRLFVLRGRRLSYYYSEDDTEERGLIDISFHRVLPATNDRITGLHATVTGATSSPTSPHNAQIPTTASTDAQKAGETAKGDSPGMFIFKLVPPRTGLSKAVNFTKPTVHYFAVDNVQQGRLWMAALMKATIDRDDSHQVITTYKEKTISLAKAKAMRQRPPALMGDDENKEEKGDDAGLAISFTNGVANEPPDEEKEGSFTTDGAAPNSSSVSAENLDRGVSAAA